MQQNPNTFPTAPQAMMLVLAGFLVRYLVGAALYDARRLLDLSDAQGDALATLLSNGLVFVVVMHHCRMTYGDLFHPGRSSVTATIALLTLPVLLLVPGLLVLDTGMDLLLTAALPLSTWEEQAFARMVGGNLGAIAGTCLLAPVLEEMLFRGIILRSFLVQYERWGAIAGSALIFGVAHLNIYQFIGAFIVGLVLGWLFERSRSLFPCILLHATYNSAILALENSGYSGFDRSTPVLSLPTIALSAVATAMSIYLFRRILKAR